MTSNYAEGDFTIHCLPEDVFFTVQKAKLMEGSEVFANMFSCCESKRGPEDSHTIDLYENANDVALLINIFRNPPSELSWKSMIKEKSQRSSTATEAAIPHPLLPRLFFLAEKYAFTPPIMSALQTHLAAQAPAAPLLVYGIATQYSLPEIADKASVFVTTPLDTYSTEHIKIIPSAEAYHKLLLLQSYRKLKMKELLEKEELFPHGYGECASHKSHAEAMWNENRKTILNEFDCGTDIGARMALGSKTIDRKCNTCQKAWVAATEMLAYKCKKAPRRISQLPHEDK